MSIGIDIGGTKVAAGVVDEQGTILERLQRPTPSHSPRAVEDAIVSTVDDLRTRHRVQSVGIGAAGWVDNTQSIVRFSPHLAWREEPLKDRLSTRIDLPLIVDNDANAAAWAEYRFGSGRGASVMVCLTLGTGIGGGLVIDGRLFRGTYGMAGEWGHMISVPGGHRCECGNRGCWEQYASGNALVREARELASTNSPMAYRLLELMGGDIEAITGPSVTAAALEGEQTAIELLADVGTLARPGHRQPRGGARSGPVRDRRRGERGRRPAAGAGPADVLPYAHRPRLPRRGAARARPLPQRRRADRGRRPGPAGDERTPRVGPLRLLAPTQGPPGPPGAPATRACRNPDLHRLLSPKSGRKQHRHADRSCC